MRLQIDTSNKTIKLDEDVNLGDLMEALNRLFPTKDWKEYKLQTNTVINNWCNPIRIVDWPGWNPFPITLPYYQPTVPYQQLPYIINCTTDTNPNAYTITGEGPIWNFID